MVSGRSHVERVKIGPKRKIAFVCSGGAAKAGAFHLGVALALQEQGFKFYGGQTPTTGAPRTPSAGSIITSYLAAGYSLDNIFNSFLDRLPEEPIDPADITPRILPRLTYQKMFKIKPGLAREQLTQLTFIRKLFMNLMNGNWEALLQLKWLKATGLFSTVGIEQYMREDVLPSNKFDDYLADLFIVATQLNHSRKVVFGKYQYEPPAHDLNCMYQNRVEISKACAASTSLPPIFSPYCIEAPSGEPVWYIDGEIRDTLSSHVALDAGADLVIASYSHQPLHYSKEIGSLTEHGLSAIVTQSIFLLIEQKIKNHIHNKDIQRKAILSVSDYCKEAGVSEHHRRRICEILEAELHHRMDVDTIYIHPSPTDSQFFFGENFTLAPKIMTETVRSGFRAAIDVLRKYDFADRVRKPATGAAGATKNG
jgi:predicted acylesterase/phospholipase RssA